MRTLRHLCVILTLISFASTDGEFSGFPSSASSSSFVSQADYQQDSALAHSSSQHVGGDEQYQYQDSPGSFAEARGAEGCKFPYLWEGKWFQSGDGSDTATRITRNTINTKGRCVESDGDKYLIYNERESCYRCVVFHGKHDNVLQYKETFCVPERSEMHEFCLSISGDAPLLTMFRLDAVPIECPFQGTFTFKYNRGKKDCENPPSTILPCIHNSRLLLNFQACPDVENTESRSEELLCLAKWKEGSSKYLVGLITNHNHLHPASYEDRFRCFVYEKKGGRGIGGIYANSSDVVIRLAQSGDATCRGLSLQEYSRIMTLTRKVPTSKPCQFPSWLQSHAQWHTLDQRSTYVFDSSIGLRVYNSSDLSGVGPNSLTMTASCSQIQENPTLDKVMLILQSTSECKNGYICAAIYKRDGHIVELQFGNTAGKADDACHISYFNQSQVPYVTLVSSTPETRQCPNVGRFQITGLVTDGRKSLHQSSSKKCTNRIDSLSIGCNSLDTLHLKSDCLRSDLLTEYACHGTWEEMGVSYLIATPLAKSSTISRRYCFAFREISTEYRFQQKLKSSSSSSSRYKQLRIVEDDESSLDLDSNDNSREYGRILQFSSIGDSCRRNVMLGIEGAIAFNVTENGRCNDLSSGSWHHSYVSYHQIILILVLIPTYYNSKFLL